MTKMMRVVVLLGTTYAFSGFAQNANQEQPVATLQVNKGVVMTSTGGDYITANSGQQLYSAERIMVSQDASATVVYSEHCKHTYDKAGVYQIDSDCKAAVWVSGAGATAAVIAGSIAIYTIAHNISEGNKGHHPPPISR
jgi:hypothetical protein